MTARNHSLVLLAGLAAMSVRGACRGGSAPALVLLAVVLLCRVVVLDPAQETNVSTATHLSHCSFSDAPPPGRGLWLGLVLDGRRGAVARVGGSVVGRDECQTCSRPCPQTGLLVLPTKLLHHSLQFVRIYLLTPVSC